MKELALSLIWSICPFLLLFAQEKEFKLDEVTVTAGRIPIAFSNLARSVIILDSEEIKSLPVSNIQDLLKYINSIDLKTRGVEGIQADAGIRGGTFEQTLILVNGVKISDPQTGHHNLNIPVSLENVERIEVLKGQGSRIFGPNAASGAINIITTKGERASLALLAQGGEHNLYNLDISASHPILFFGNNISFAKKKSDGYIPNTNFDITQFSLSQNYSFSNSNINAFFGYIDKKFGANNFYSDRYPNQWEHTTTKLFFIASKLGSENFSISPKIFWRRNDDDYILDYTRPTFYRNNHKTFSYGGEIQSSIRTSLGITTFGGEFNKEEITSSNLGIHSREKGGIFGEHFFEPFHKIFVSIGFFVYKYSSVDWKFWPGVDIAYRISDEIKTFITFGKSFRIPTFTELYYTSPANLGNPNLTFEETTNYELGFAYSMGPYQVETSIFFKDGRNLIDWARVSEQEPWKVENVSSVKTYGGELNLDIFVPKLYASIPITKVSLSYTFLALNRSTGIYESKYLLDNLRNQLIVNITNKLPLGLQQSWSLVLRDRVNFNPQFTVDTQINAQFSNFELFVRGTNIFNKKYEDFAGVILPGRWVSAGIKLHWSEQ